MINVRPGTLVQITEKIPEWIACVMVVDEVSDNKILAYIPMPEEKVIYRVLHPGEYEVVGQSLFKFNT